MKGDCDAALEMISEMNDGEDAEERQLFIVECTHAATESSQDGQRYELELLLSGPYDNSPCRSVLTAGAGGAEACDWSRLPTMTVSRENST